MTPVDSFAGQLAALLTTCGLQPARLDDAATRVRSGDLDVTITLREANVLVDLSGWRHAFALTPDDDGSDAAALALDLIGAALFGDVRVVVERWNDQPRRFTLELRRAGAWHPGPVQGARPWTLLARRSVTVHRGDTPRPAAHAPVPVTPLPWAPWAGYAGFYGAAASPEADPAELPIDGVLDLHNFSPKDVKRLVLEYLEVCRARGITEVRIVHGKGIGALRRTVHALLDRHPHVRAYRLGGDRGGQWGATVVDLSPKTAPDPEPRG